MISLSQPTSSILLPFNPPSLSDKESNNNQSKLTVEIISPLVIIQTASDISLQDNNNSDNKNKPYLIPIGFELSRTSSSISLISTL